MGAVKIPYYVVIKGRGYWRPTKRMRGQGFQIVRCGPDGPPAWAIAATWNRRWQAVRRGEAKPPNAEPQGGEKSESDRVYAAGSVGAAFRAYRITKEWSRKPQSTREKVWWPAWFRIRAMWGEVDPNTITLDQMSTWRADLEAAHGLGVAHKTLKIWRALWVIMRAQKIAIGEDPSKAVRNSAPAPRGATWTEREALILVKTAWRHGYKGLACIIAVTWDSLFQPGDVRTLCARHKRSKDGQRYFDRTSDGRAKTGMPAIGTVSRRTAHLVDVYLDGIEPLPDTILFRTRSGAPYRDMTLSHDFAAVREIAFPGERRQLRDMRRSGTVEAVAGGAEASALADKLANSIDRSTTLRKTYAPINLAAVANADDARRRGRKKIGGKAEEW